LYIKLDRCSAEDAGRILRLSSTELNILKLEVESTTEDPILVLKLNAMWVAAHGQGTAGTDRLGGFSILIILMISQIAVPMYSPIIPMLLE
jgi:hypothetical protein